MSSHGNYITVWSIRETSSHKSSTQHDKQSGRTDNDISHISYFCLSLFLICCFLIHPSSHACLKLQSNLYPCSEPPLLIRIAISMSGGAIRGMSECKGSGRVITGKLDSDRTGGISVAAKTKRKTEQEFWMKGWEAVATVKVTWQ